MHAPSSGIGLKACDKSFDPEYILGLYWDNGKENGNYYNGLYRGQIGLYWGYIGIIDKKMEATIVYCGDLGITEN